MIAFAFAALVTRLWFLQVLAAEEYQERATGNSVRLIPNPGPRGQILDRNGEPVVDNRRTIVITIDREELRDQEDVLDRLAGLLDTSTIELEERLHDPDYLPYQPVPVYEGAPEAVAIYLAEHATEFPGVGFEEIGVRRYVRGTLAPHLLGSLGEISPDELLDPSFADVRPGQLVGRGGVEQQYETFLRGRDGLIKQEVNAQGQIQSILGVEEPVPGDDLVLSIDADIQELTQDTLEDAVNQARVSVVDEETGTYVNASAGAVVVMDPNDGHVLAMASYPTYDP
ncbi:MAG: penicillin-binding protein 2, partial [Actinomycetota bacterium]